VHLARDSHTSTLPRGVGDVRDDGARRTLVVDRACVSVCESLTWQLALRRELRGVASMSRMTVLAAVISALVTRQLSSLFRQPNLYESVFESYLFLAGQAHSLQGLRNPDASDRVK
jgi:hypothetical protein